jgi:8-oxo-dGTP pyrophosphatase MutT (NUDIX family)
MYIKIYFDDKPLFLCDKLEPVIEAYSHHDDAIFMDEFSTSAVNTMIHEMQQSKVHAGIMLHNNLDDLKHAFLKKFTIVQAAGGLIESDKGRKLFIFRRGKWDLPKGKLDPGETLEICATREINEETGLTGHELVAPLSITYHTYHENGKFILKESHWFRFKCSDEPKLAPQEEEQITAAEWLDEEGLDKVKRNTYPLILDLLSI